MTMDDDARHGDRHPAARPNRRQIAIGAAGLAAVLGGGAYLLTTQIVDRQHTTAVPDTGTIRQVTPAGSAEAGADSLPLASDSAPPPSVRPAPSSNQAVPSSSAPPPTRSPNSAALRREIDRARAAAAKDGHPLQRPLEQTGKLVAESEISTRTEQTAEGTIRISSARADLSGQQDQLLAADNGTPVGDVRCARRIHFSAGAAPREIPTLLLCWRTSAHRSVVTLAVAKKGRPSDAASAATIDREWAKLG